MIPNLKHTAFFIMLAIFLTVVASLVFYIIEVWVLGIDPSIPMPLIFRQSNGELYDYEK